MISPTPFHLPSSYNPFSPSRTGAVGDDQNSRRVRHHMTPRDDARNLKHPGLVIKVLERVKSPFSLRVPVAKAVMPEMADDRQGVERLPARQRCPSRRVTLGPGLTRRFIMRRINHRTHAPTAAVPSCTSDTGLTLFMALGDW